MGGNALGALIASPVSPDAALLSRFGLEDKSLPPPTLHFALPAEDFSISHTELLGGHGTCSVELGKTLL